MAKKSSKLSRRGMAQHIKDLTNSAASGNVESYNELIRYVNKVGQRVNNRITNMQKFNLKGSWYKKARLANYNEGRDTVRFNNTLKRLRTLSIYQLEQRALFYNRFMNGITTIKEIRKNWKKTINNLNDIGISVTINDYANWHDFVESDYFKLMKELDSDEAVEGFEALQRGATIADLEHAYEKYLNGIGDAFENWEEWLQSQREDIFHK